MFLVPFRSQTGYQGLQAAVCLRTFVRIAIHATSSDIAAVFKRNALQPQLDLFSAVDMTPGFLGGLNRFKRQTQEGGSRYAVARTRTRSTMAYHRKRRFDRIGRSHLAEWIVTTRSNTANASAWVTAIQIDCRSASAHPFRTLGKA